MEKSLFHDVSNSVGSRKYYCKILNEFSIRDYCLVDFGCGEGHFSLIAARCNKKIIAIDKDFAGIEKLANHRCSNIQVEIGGLEKLSQVLISHPVELIVLSNCIQYLNINELIGTVNISKFSGKIFISTAQPSYYSKRLIHALQNWNLREIIRYIILVTKANLIPYNWYNRSLNEKPITVKNIHSAMRKAGFKLCFPSPKYYNIWSGSGILRNSGNIFYAQMFERKNNDIR